MKDGLWIESLTIGYQRGRKTTMVAEKLSATLEKGRLTCLLGRNGTGKSTLLRTLAGLQKPLDGQISPEFHENCAIVLTEQPDLQNFTVEEVVGLGRTPHTNFWGTLREEDRAIVRHAMQQVDIAHFAAADIASLSDGERQKVMISKALAQQTEVILLDEPTAFLDFVSRREVFLLLQRLAHEQGKAILLSTHEIALADAFADTIWLFDEGQLKIKNQS